MLFVRHTACQQTQVIVILHTWNCLLLNTSTVICNGSIEQKLRLQNILCWTGEWVRDMNSRTLMCIVTSTLALKCLSRITSLCDEKSHLTQSAKVQKWSQLSEIQQDWGVSVSHRYLEYAFMCGVKGVCKSVLKKIQTPQNQVREARNWCQVVGLYQVDSH